MAIPGGALLDGSDTITAGGTEQTVFAAKTDRQYLLIQNVSMNDLWINFGIAAVIGQPSIRLSQGASIEFSAGGTGVVPTALVSIIGGTTSQAFVAKQF